MKERERERERERVTSCGKICIEWKKESHIYNNRMRIRKVKIKGREMDRWRVTLRLKVVERCKVKRDIMVWNSEEK